MNRDYNIGDILCGKCGYDRTDVHFYKVLDRTAKTLTIQEIESDVVSGDPMRVYYVVPNETKLKERVYVLNHSVVSDTKPFKVYLNKNGVAIIRDGGQFADQWLSVWDGEPKWCNTGYQG